MIENIGAYSQVDYLRGVEDLKNKIISNLADFQLSISPTGYESEWVAAEKKMIYDTIEQCIEGVSEMAEELKGDEKMSKKEIIAVLKAMCKAFDGFKVNAVPFGFLITDSLDRDNPERQMTYDLESFVNNYYDLIVMELKKNS